MLPGTGVKQYTYTDKTHKRRRVENNENDQTRPSKNEKRKRTKRCASTYVQVLLLDVLTPLSDGRQESVEKMERRISGVSYMYWMDFYNEIFCCGFLRARLTSVSFSGSLFRLPRRGLPRPYRCIQANRLPRLQGYHTRATTLHVNFWVQAGYHTCG